MQNIKWNPNMTWSLQKFGMWIVTRNNTQKQKNKVVRKWENVIFLIFS